MRNFFRNLFGEGQKENANQPAVGVPQPDPRHHVQRQREDELYRRGDVIGGKYEVYGTLGKGGFGIIYLVYSRETRSVYALKTFRDEFLFDSAARDIFKKEALLWVNLDRHPYILSAELVEEFSGRLFVAMDYIAPDQSGRVSLADYLAHSAGVLDTAKPLRWAIQFCRGMEHANSHGIKCHRDIKPSNILITQDGILKITDFGLAAAAEVVWRDKGSSFIPAGDGRDISLSVIQREGRGICGTPGYMAPEVYRGEGTDIRSDIYSFGLVLWQMLVGSVVPPFHVDVKHEGDYGRYVQEYCEAVYHRQMRGELAEVDSPVFAVIRRCLEREPGYRYATFEQLRLELDPIIRDKFGEVVHAPRVDELQIWEWGNKGVSLNSLGHYEEAIACYNKALEIDPLCAAAWNNTGTSLGSLGRYQEAINCFDKSLEIDPRNDYAWNNKGNSLNSLGRHQEAIYCFDKYLESDPRNAAAWSNKGNSLYSLGQYEEAIACLDKALEIDPQLAEAWYNKGTRLNSLGRYEKAIRCCDKALEIDPLYAAAWNNKGISLKALGRYQEAIYCYDKALEIDPRDAVAWNNKGVSLDYLDRYEEAISCCDKALEIDPRYAYAWNNKGNSLDSFGRYQEAIYCYDKALEIDPRYAAAWNNKGISLKALGRHQEAIYCYDKALEIDPRYAVAWYNKALAEDKLGRFRDAVKSYSTFIELESAQTKYARRQRIAHARQRLKELQ